MSKHTPGKWYAAPELLEARIKVRQWAEGDSINYQGEHVIAKARAAIAKATGADHA